MNKIVLSEIFPSIQGEGRYVGKLMLFIRFSGCTRTCSFCDSSYHTEGKEVSVAYLEKKIKEYKGDTICLTGGEPLRQFDLYKDMVSKFRFEKGFQLETNGDLLEGYMFDYFDYVAVSPKDIEVAKKVQQLRYDNFDLDIKVVTDLKTVGVDMIEYATMLMPLTTDNEEESKQITQEVWRYCVDNRIHFCPRIHYYIWGKQRRV